MLVKGDTETEYKQYKIQHNIYNLSVMRKNWKIGKDYNTTILFYEGDTLVGSYITIIDDYRGTGDGR